MYRFRNNLLQGNKNVKIKQKLLSKVRKNFLLKLLAKLWFTVWILTLNSK